MNEAQQWQLLSERIQKQCWVLDQHISRCLELGRAGSFDWPELDRVEVAP